MSGIETIKIRKSVTFDEIDSTNSYCKREIVAGSMTEFPAAVSARMQTAGRGRLTNRSFFSPRGGLYASLAVRASSIACGADSITMAAGVAAADAIEELCDCAVSLKWVNDIMIGGKKAGGILCESVPCERIAERVYIIGIGINLSAASLAGFMPEKVCALPSAVSFERLQAVLLRNLLRRLNDTSEAIAAAYNRRLTICGKRVEVRRGGKAVAVTVTGASAEGLACRTDDGQSFVVRTCDEIVTDLYGVR